MNGKLMEAFEHYLQERTQESFLNARRVLMSLPSYNPMSPELYALDEMLRAGDWHSMRDLASQVVDNWMLTPYIHEALALAYKKLDDHERSSLEYALSVACAEGIISTGDGTAEKPYLVVRSDDAYGVLNFLEIEWTEERRVDGPNGSKYLLLIGNNGREFWFDLTDTFLVRKHDLANTRFFGFGRRRPARRQGS